jgi:hypothetical protein
MKLKPNLESLIYFAVIVLCLASLVLVVAAAAQFSGTKLVYQAF